MAYLPFHAEHFEKLACASRPTVALSSNNDGSRQVVHVVKLARGAERLVVRVGALKWILGKAKRGELPSFCLRLVGNPRLRCCAVVVDLLLRGRRDVWCEISNVSFMPGEGNALYMGFLFVVLYIPTSDVGHFLAKGKRSHTLCTTTSWKGAIQSE